MFLFINKTSPCGKYFNRILDTITIKIIKVPSTKENCKLETCIKYQNRIQDCTKKKKKIELTLPNVVIYNIHKSMSLIKSVIN